MRIRVEYKAGVIDEYPIKREDISKLLEQFLNNPNIIKITFEKEID